jgi:hypothetical protein
MDRNILARLDRLGIVDIRFFQDERRSKYSFGVNLPPFW